MKKTKLTQMVMSSVDGKDKVIANIDWKERKVSKTIQLTFEDKTIEVNAEEFMGIAFAIASPEAQEKMIPSHTITTRMIEKAVQIEATKDIKKGEKITAMLRFYIPDDALRAMLEMPLPEAK